jgi:hypothetical protein
MLLGCGMLLGFGSLAGLALHAGRLSAPTARASTLSSIAPQAVPIAGVVCHSSHYTLTAEIHGS